MRPEERALLVVWIQKSGSGPKQYLIRARGGGVGFPSGNHWRHLLFNQRNCYSIALLEACACCLLYSIGFTGTNWRLDQHQVGKSNPAMRRLNLRGSGLGVKRMSPIWKPLHSEGAMPIWQGCLTTSWTYKTPKQKAWFYTPHQRFPWLAEFL